MAATPAGRFARRGAVAVAALSLSCVAAFVHAQAANPFVGNWRATFKVTTTTGLVDERHADIDITPTGGTWHARVQARQDPCAGKEVPVVIKEVTDTQLTGSVRYSALADFCKDVTLVLQRDAGGKVTGRRGSWALTLEPR